MKNWLQLIPKIVGYKFFRAFDWPKIMPFMLTVSVTNQCNSKCKTCNIWKIYYDNPQLLKEELSLNEYDLIFKNIGDSIIWYNLSGGEPFLRKDLSQICKIMYENSNPKFFTIPTNGLMPKIIVNRTKEILDYCEASKIVINLSVDEIYTKHDEIRGVNKNFEKIIETFKGLKELKKVYKNLDLGIHSVVSKYNVNSLSSVYAFITNELGPDSFICSPAQNRNELLNLNEDIAPDIDAYEKWVDLLRLKTQQDYMVKKGIPKIIQAARLKYYDLAIEELKLKKQIIPCYAGFASCQITPYGDVWPCCTLAYEAIMGNLRDANYSFKKIWHSKNAEKIRTGIKNGLCNCPMANIHYTNMLCNIPIMINLVSNILLN